MRIVPHRGFAWIPVLGFFLALYTTLKINGIWNSELITVLFLLYQILSFAALITLPLIHIL